MTPEQNALVRLGQLLKKLHYEFVTVTPDTHQRVNARAERQVPSAEPSLRDVFGWNRWFRESAMPDAVIALLREADALETQGELRRSKVRFSTLGEHLFVHSSFPTVAPDAVFFGPDTYRFCALLRRWAPASLRAIDLGCGSGAGAISIAERVRAEQFVLADINPRALQLAEVNARLARFEPTLVLGDLFAGVEGQFDLIIANPPYMRDALARAYRDGGGAYGESLAVRIVRESLSRLHPGGTLIVYTGAAIVAGRDTFRAAVAPILSGRALDVQYEELDPDVFGDELEQPAYANVERIAAVGLKVCDS